MKTITASIARKRFTELLDSVQTGPVCIQRHGRDVAVMLSSDEFRRLWEGAREGRVQYLHAESAKRWAHVYGALSD